MAEYDYLIVGTGLYGAVFAYEAGKKGKKCLLLEKRSHVGGNVYTEQVAGIHVHRYGAHIFHTNNREVFEFLSRFHASAPFAVFSFYYTGCAEVCPASKDIRTGFGA